MSRRDAELLYSAVVASGHRDYLEIGTAWGGSAILAALAKQDYKMSGLVYCIDPFDGFRDGVKIDDELYPKDPSRTPIIKSTVRANAQIFGVVEYLRIIQAKSIPTPLPFPLELGCLFIDGNHSKESVMADYDAYGPMVMPGGYIMLHDIDYTGPKILLATIRGRQPESIRYVTKSMAVIQKWLL